MFEWTLVPLLLSCTKLKRVVFLQTLKGVLAHRSIVIPEEWLKFLALQNYFQFYEDKLGTKWITRWQRLDMSSSSLLQSLIFLINFFFIDLTKNETFEDLMKELRHETKGDSITKAKLFIFIIKKSLLNNNFFYFFFVRKTINCNIFCNLTGVKNCQMTGFSEVTELKTNRKLKNL